MSKQKGFSLIELAIAISVIALLIAVTFTGSELLKGSELKTITAEVEEMKGALKAFDDVYKGLPGDITNASSYWTTANGDGDGFIDAETTNEPFAALQQIAFAGMIKTTEPLTGTWGTGFILNLPAIAGNVIPSKSNRAGTFIYAKCCSGTDYARTISFNNHISISSINTNDDYRNGALTPVEAKNLDTKMDDGIPDYGFVGGSGNYATPYSALTCYSGTGATSTYQSANATYKDLEGCQMQFAYDWN